MNPIAWGQYMSNLIKANPNTALVVKRTGRHFRYALVGRFNKEVTQ